MQSTWFPQDIHKVIHIIHRKHKIFYLNGLKIQDLVVDKWENGGGGEDF